MALITEYVRTLVPVNWRSNPSGWTSGNCPMCIVNGETRADTKGRGGFKFEDEKVQYHCFNCSYATGWSPGKRISYKLKKLMLQFGAHESDVQRLQLELMQEDDLAKILSRKAKRKEPVVIDWERMELPEGSTPFMEVNKPADEWTKAADYLTTRGFDVADDRFMITDSKHPARMNKRFIIVSTYKGVPVGYTGRWVGEPPKDMPKYYNKQPPKNFVFGLDKQTADKETVIVSEGQLDAMVTDGCSIGSNNINDDQANIIDSLKKRVVLLADADKAGMDMIKTAVERGWEVAFPEWDGCKDAADAQMKYGRLFTVKSILESAVRNPTKIKVMSRKYCK